METNEKRFKTVIIVLISICLGFIIRMSSVIIADRNLFSMYNIDLLILFIAIIGLIIWLNKKKKGSNYSVWRQKGFYSECLGGTVQTL